MFLRTRIKDPNTLIRIGLVALILASVWKYFAVDYPSSRFTGTVVDGVTGLLYGLAIGSLLLGVRRNSRLHKQDGKRKTEDGSLTGA